MVPDVQVSTTFWAEDFPPDTFILLKANPAPAKTREVLDRFWKTGNVGVGLAGIRERLKELGGFLAIESDLDGTLVKATIPVADADSVEPDPAKALLFSKDIA